MLRRNGKTRRRKNTQFSKKNQKGGDDDDFLSVEFETIKNTGRAENNMSNQCFWISLRDFFNYYLDEHEKIKVSDLRAYFEDNNLQINGPHEMFDYPIHGRALEIIAEIFYLHITIYDVYSGKINVDRYTVYGPRNGIPVNIAFFGTHFELITSIGGINVLPDKERKMKDFNMSYANFVKKQVNKIRFVGGDRHRKTQKKRR